MFAVEKFRSRMEDAVWRDSLDFLQIRDRKAAASKREGWRLVIGETVARKPAELHKKENLKR
jgi:hypothetical protein